jgi:hypothetical protein
MQGKHYALIHTRMPNPFVTIACYQLIETFEPTDAAASIELDEGGFTQTGNAPKEVGTGSVRKEASTCPEAGITSDYPPIPLRNRSVYAGYTFVSSGAKQR